MRNKIVLGTLTVVLIGVLMYFYINLYSSAQVVISPYAIKSSSFPMLYSGFIGTINEVVIMALLIMALLIVILLIILKRVINNKKYLWLLSSLILVINVSMTITFLMQNQYKSSHFVSILLEGKSDLKRKQIIKLESNGTLNEELEFHKFRTTPLCWAVLLGDYSTVRELLSKGADVNLKDSFGKTPIMYACSKYWNKKSILSLLLNQKGITISWDSQHLDIINYAMNKEIPNSLFIFLTSNPKIKDVLLTKDNKGRSKLMIAAFFDEYEYCKILLEQEPSLKSMKDLQGFTAFDYAKKCHPQSSKLLRILKM